MARGSFHYKRLHWIQNSITFGIALENCCSFQTWSVSKEKFLFGRPYRGFNLEYQSARLAEVPHKSSGVHSVLAKTAGQARNQGLGNRAIALPQNFQNHV